MIKFLRNIAETGCPRARVFAIFFAILILWTAKGLALTPAPGTPIINTATAQYGDANGNPLSTANSNTVSAILSGAARLKITVLASPNPVSPGGTLIYTITIDNTGNISATAVTAVATLSTNLQFAGATNGGTSSPPAVNWNLGTISSGESVTLILTATANAGVPSGTNIPFSITATPAEGVSDSASLITKIGSAANLVITKSSSVTGTTPGGIIEYTINYGNIGNIAATNAAIRDELPSNINLVAGSITGGGSIAGSIITWPLGSLAPGASGTVSFRVVVSTLAANGDVISNFATISSNETTTSSSNTLSIPVTTAALTAPTAAKVFSPKTIPVNGASVVTITLTNPNTTAITGVAFTDTYPANLVNTVSASPATTCGGIITAVNGGTALSLAGGTIPASGSCTITVNVTSATAGSYTNSTGTVSSANAAAGAAATDILIVLTPPTAIKSFSPSIIPVSGSSVMTITLTNPNATAITGVALTDTYPANLLNTASASPVTTCGGTLTAVNGGTALSLTGGTIPASGNCTVTVNVTSATVGSYTNNTGTISADGPMTIASASGAISVVQLLSIQKTVTTTIARPGNLLAYAVTIKNESEMIASNIIIRDTLPSGVTFFGTDGGGTATGGTVSWSIATLHPGATATVHLNVTIDKTFSAASISNTARVTADSMNELQSTVVKDITSRTVGSVAFFDVSWQPAYGYMDGQTIYIQVTDADQNLDPAIAETVTVVLTNLTTGDAETVTLTETGPSTGIFRGSISSTLTTTANYSGILTVAANSRIQATYTDALDDSPVHNTTALIDPQGIVFDSVTGNTLAGAVVTLRNWNNVTHTCDLTSWPVLPAGQINPAATTGTDGKFAFPLVSPGNYCFDVTPPSGYTFPSAIADANLPAGFTIGNGSRGDKFTLSAGDPALIRDIPVDPPAGRLVITKTANKATAAIGDMIIYTLTLTNNGDAQVTGIMLTDIMPHGIAYINGSSQTDGNAFIDPHSAGTGAFSWSTASLAPNKSLTISYRAVVGPDTRTGDAINTVSASGTSTGRTIVSNKASFKIKIADGVFTTKGTIIGRVFIDHDGNGLAKKDSGVPDAALYLEDGTRVITDKSGKFSMTGIVQGTHVLRLDETSLPKGLVPKPGSNRFMKNGSSQFVDMTPGGLFKANFAVDKKVLAPEDKSKEEQRIDPETGSKATDAIKPQGAKMLNNKVLFYAEEASEVTAQEDASDSAPAIIAHGSRIPETVPVEVTPEVPSPGAEETPAPEEKSITKPETVPAVKETSAGNEKLPTQDAPELPLEEQILKMTPELEFLKPFDQSVTQRNSIRVLIKAPADNVLTLTVNGDTVDNSQIGTKIKNEKGRVIIYEFIDVRLKTGEENIIRAEVKDSFGIARGAKQIRVGTIGNAKRIAIRPDRKETAADGQSRIVVTASVEDEKGRPVFSYSTVTVSVTAGEILEKDADPANEGHQIVCQDGIARFTIIAPRETGDAKIQVQASDLKAEAAIYFTPNLRPMFIVGLGEIVLGHGRSNGDISYLKDRTFFGDGPYLDGRGAFFMKGNIYKDFVITAAYDSKKKSSDELFRESDTRLDSEDKYPLYGDESKTGYEALSRENLYVKLEKGKSYVLYGDYQTDLKDTKLSAYTRSFNGLKAEVNTDNFKLRSFGTYTDQSQFVDVIPGKGISGLYYLNSNQIIDGSERVAIETRDRLQPDRVLRREAKSRGSDYDIDYGMGTILFKEPIPGHDSEGNPLYIVATYEGIGGGNKYLVYGGRGAFKVNDKLEVGATGIVEENSISNYELFGTDVTLNLPFKTTIKAEYAHTRGLFDISSTFVPETGDGWLVDLKSQPLEKLAVTAYFQTLSNFFSNPSATDAVRGTRKWGLDAAYEMMPSLTVKAKYLDEYDNINDSSHLLASAGVTKKFTKTTISAEVLHETSDNVTSTPAQTPYTPGGLLNGVPFLNSYETPNKATFLKLALERELLPNLSLALSHKQDVEGNALSITEGGFNYKITNSSRLYIREEYAKYQDSTQTRTLIGAESQVTKNTTAYQEYRLADGSAGYRNQQVMGLKNKVQIMEGVSANIAGEYLSTLSGQQNKNEPDAYAFAATLEYLPRDDIKLTSRAEHRHEIVEDGKDSYLAEVAMAYKLNPDYSLLLRERYFLEKNGVDESHTSRLMAGLAYRPLDNDRFNALGKIEYKYNRQSASVPSYTTDAFILSTEGIYQISRDLQFMGKYAGKLEKDDSFTSYTNLIAARIMYDLTDRFDIGAEYRLLTSYLTHTSLNGGSIEAGYRIIDQLWFSLGYSFDRFDADLTGDSYQGNGPYLKLRFKFDENTLKSIR
jgi:uncharacterized repeat protein (TIGR01451 family)